ncbi:MAG: hypothetical protein LBL41_02255 [Bifidobacteriaceae bacterium]|jgi:hypothetical protein|nr:hypothetical protein [Bifidobacteriaceae bacterium]
MCEYKKPMATILDAFLGASGVEIVVNKKEYDAIFDWYAKNYKEHETETEFMDSAEKDIRNNAYKSNAALAEINKQFRTKKGLQSGILSECFYSQTIANTLNLNNFVDCDADSTNSVLLKVFRDFGITNSRYIYHNTDKTVILCQSGAPQGFDAVFIECDCVIHIEFKESFAKLGEYDIAYDNFGSLVADEKFTLEHPDSVPMVNYFNEAQKSILPIIGQNYRSFSAESLQSAAKAYFAKLDMLFTVDENNVMMPIPQRHLFDFFDLSESELRSAGRNHYSIWTPKLFESVILESGGEIEGSVVSFPKNKILPTHGARGTAKSTRIKLHQLFFVRISDAIDEGHYIMFNLSVVRQLKSTVAVKIRLSKTFVELQNALKGEL